MALNSTIRTIHLCPLAKHSYMKEGSVPFIIASLGIHQGVNDNTLVICYNIFPTIAELDRNSTAIRENIDGQSIEPLLFKKSFNRSQPLIFHSPYHVNNIS
ncbi:MAG: arylsulfatase A-like enzyme [Cyclobacteriaceae bacterium]|jgi:arylsulfatase A-like enzyme